MSIPFPKLLTRDRRTAAKTISGIVVSRDDTKGATKTPKDLPGRATNNLTTTDFYPFDSDSDDYAAAEGGAQFRASTIGAGTIGSGVSGSRKNTRILKKYTPPPVFNGEYDRASEIVSIAPSVQSEREVTRDAERNKTERSEDTRIAERSEDTTSTEQDEVDVDNSQRRSSLGNLRGGKDYSRDTVENISRSPSIVRSPTRLSQAQSPSRSPLSRPKTPTPLSSRQNDSQSPTRGPLRSQSPTRSPLSRSPLSRGTSDPRSPLSRGAPLPRSPLMRSPESPISEARLLSSKPPSPIASQPPFKEDFTETIIDTTDSSVQGDDEIDLQENEAEEARVEAIQDLLDSEHKTEAEQRYESIEDESSSEEVEALNPSRSPRSYTPSQRYNEEVITDPGDRDPNDDHVDPESSSESDTEMDETRDDDLAVQAYERATEDRLLALEDERESVKVESDTELRDTGLPVPPTFLARNPPIRSFKSQEEKSYTDLGFRVMRTFHLYQPGTISNLRNHYLVQMSSCFGDIFFIKFNNPVLIGDSDPVRLPLSQHDATLKCPSNSFQELMRGPDVVTTFVDGLIYNGKIYTSQDSKEIKIVSPYVFPVYLDEPDVNLVELCANARANGAFLEKRIKKTELNTMKNKIVSRLKQMIKNIEDHHQLIEDVDMYRTEEANKLYDIFEEDIKRGKIIPSSEDTHRITHLTETMIRYTTSHMSLWCALSEKLNDFTRVFEESSPHIYAQISTDYPELNIKYADST